MCPDGIQRRLWKRQGQRADRAFPTARHTAPKQSVMMWGVISFEIRIPLDIIRSTLTAQRYVDNILRPVLARKLVQIWQEIPQDTI